MIDVLEGAELVLEPPDRVRQKVAKRFQRDLRAALAVDRLVHISRGAAADAAHDAEAPGLEGGRVHFDIDSRTRRRCAARLLSSSAMTAGEHTKRDTFAFVLVILGATFWAVFPAVRLLADKGYGPEIGIPVSFAVGALLGAWAGTTVWRHVSSMIPVLAATALAVFILVLRHYSLPHETGIRVHEVIRVASATLGAGVGAFLARRTREPRRALVAALISVSGIVVTGLSIGLVDALGGDLWSPTAAFLTMFGVGPGAAIAVRLCGRVRPGAFTGWVFAFLASAVFIALADDPKYGRAEALVPSIVLPAILAFIASIPVRRAHRLQPVAEELPTAQVVDR
jgi:hypothetical protein